MAETFEQMVARIKAGAWIGGYPMAKQVKLPKGREFTFKTAKGGGASKYDWDTMLSGELLLIEQSEGDKDATGKVVNVRVKKDYEVDTESMPGKLKFAARKKYKIVQISRVDANGDRLVDSLIIKARDMDDDERAGEDEKRAKEKYIEAERRAARKASPTDSTANTAPAA